MGKKPKACLHSFYIYLCFVKLNSEVKNKKLALIVAYYLARFNRKGLEKLGYPTFKAAFTDVGLRLEVKENYIKLSRDEFDPLFEWRKGWDRPMRRQIISVVEAFQDLDFEGLHSIVKSIINKSPYFYEEDATKLLSVINSEEDTELAKYNALRTLTGKKAEEFFIEYHNV